MSEKKTPTTEVTEEKTTGNSKKGFASNPAAINRAGRPKGSRNKSTLLRAQIQMDTDTEYAAEMLGAVMRNDKDFLGITQDVPMSLRIAAVKEVLNKSIANESTKEPSGGRTVEEEEDEKPLFSMTPVAQLEKQA